MTWDEPRSLLWFSHADAPTPQWGISEKLSSDLMVDFLSCVPLQVWPPSSQTAPSTIHERKPMPLQWPVYIGRREQRMLQACFTHWTVQLEEQAVLGGTSDNLKKKRKEEAVEACQVDGRWVGGGLKRWKHQGEREQTRICFHWAYMFRKHFWPCPLVYSYLISWRSVVKSEGCVTAWGKRVWMLCVCWSRCALLYTARYDCCWRVS